MERKRRIKRKKRTKSKFRLRQEIDPTLTIHEGKCLALFDTSGVIMLPWAEAGYECYCIDIQEWNYEIHNLAYGRLGYPNESAPYDPPQRVRIDEYRCLASVIFPSGGSINFVSCDVYSSQIDKFIKENEWAFTCSFPPCTHLSGVGRGHFKKKFAEDPEFQINALRLVQRGEYLHELAGAPYFIENPKGDLRRLWGGDDPERRKKWDFTFDPCEYAGFLPEDHANLYVPSDNSINGGIEDRDIYYKYTCLWTGNGFRMPPKDYNPYTDEYHEYCPKRVGKKSQVAWFFGSKVARVARELSSRISEPVDPAYLRSLTPEGFARGVFECNRPDQPPLEDCIQGP